MHEYALDQQFDTLPQVAVPKMNSVHEEELELVLTLINALNEKDDKVIDALMQDWLLHTQVHFADEETLMVRYGFPAYDCHRSEHEGTLQRLRGEQQAWQATRDRARATRFIFHQWRPWLENHIATMDTVTAAYLSRCAPESEL